MTRRPAAAVLRGPPASKTGDGLAPVRDALLAAARSEAAEVSARAGQAAAETRAAARRQAAAVLDRARAEGEAAADQALAAERIRARREAHRVSLAARRRAWEQLRSQCRAAAAALAADPGYPQLSALLVEAARSRLGDGATFVVDGPEGPGVVARDAGRRVDLRLEVLADRALAHLGSRVEDLWR